MLCYWTTSPSGEVLVFDSEVGYTIQDSEYGSRAWDPAQYDENPESEPVGVLEALPVAASMRRSATNDFGGPLDISSDVPRWDGGAPSRYRTHVCRKDWRETDQPGWYETTFPRKHKHDMRRTRRAVRELKEVGYGCIE